MSRDHRKCLTLRSKSFSVIVQDSYTKLVLTKSYGGVFFYMSMKLYWAAATHHVINGGHFSSDIIGHKVFQAGLWWWPTVLKDAWLYAK